VPDILKVTVWEQKKVHKSVEKLKEMPSSEGAIYVMCHDSKRALDGSVLFLVNANVPSLRSLWLKGDSFGALEDASDSSLLDTGISGARSRHRTRRGKSRLIEKFSAEGSMALSATAVLAAIPYTRSGQAVANLTISMTEQRRCAAA